MCCWWPTRRRSRICYPSSRTIWEEVLCSSIIVFVYVNNHSNLLFFFHKLRKISGAETMNKTCPRSNMLENIRLFIAALNLGVWRDCPKAGHEPWQGRGRLSALQRPCRGMKTVLLNVTYVKCQMTLISLLMLVYLLWWYRNKLSHVVYIHI